MGEIDTFHHRAMATHFEVRIAGEKKTYAGQAAQAAFELLDRLEAQLSRFRANSEIARIAQLAVGETMRLSEPVYACLALAKRMEVATCGAFSATHSALRTQTSMPLWTLAPESESICCERGRLEFDLGAIGKGFALDRMADLLRGWDCLAFLLVAGGSSILAGDAPGDATGWSCGLGDNDTSQRIMLTQSSLSGSGLAVKGEHILDPRTARPALRQSRAWALADTAAESDALSTACMILHEDLLQEILTQHPAWRVFLEGDGPPRVLGARGVPV